MWSKDDLLSNVHVAKPCPASWANMQGSDQVRHCTHCKLNVYNLSAMTRAEAENLIKQNEGRLCARFFRRPDGTIITKDCPRGVHAARLKIARFTAIGILALFTFAKAMGLKLDLPHTLGKDEIIGDIPTTGKLEVTK